MKFQTFSFFSEFDLHEHLQHSVKLLRASLMKRIVKDIYSQTSDYVYSLKNSIDQDNPDVCMTIAFQDSCFNIERQSDKSNNNSSQ